MDAPERVFTADALRALGLLVTSLARRSSSEHAKTASCVDRATDPASDEGM
jgi:hypothetical protein